MEINFIKDNDFNEVEFNDIKGFIFKPRNKKITNLEIVDNRLIKKILNIKINKDIDKSNKTIKLMISSGFTDVNDCNIMIEELYRIARNLENKYIKYFNEFEYFDLVKRIYKLNMSIVLKKKLLIGLIK